MSEELITRYVASRKSIVFNAIVKQCAISAGLLVLFSLAVDFVWSVLIHFYWIVSGNSDGKGFFSITHHIGGKLINTESLVYCLGFIAIKALIDEFWAKSQSRKITVNILSYFLVFVAVKMFF